jgi:uncharacterized protein YndB with AHSA1/START domain
MKGDVRMTQTHETTLRLTTPSDLEVVMTRVFDAPRELVFRAFTDPALIAQWWGPANQATRFDQQDLRPGGQWRYVKIAPDGTEYVFHGEFREVVPPERLVNTFAIVGMPGEPQLQIFDFMEEEGRTTMTFTTRFATTEERDRTLNYGMEAGAAASYDRLAALLLTLV